MGAHDSCRAAVVRIHTEVGYDHGDREAGSRWCAVSDPLLGAAEADGDRFPMLGMKAYRKDYIDPCRAVDAGLGAYRRHIGKAVSEELEHHFFNDRVCSAITCSCTGSRAVDRPGYDPEHR
jgi:hypothetical protein